MTQTLLITGAAGYIGSHFVETLLESKPDFLTDVRLILLDNLSSGHESSIQTLSDLALSHGFAKPEFFEIDLLDESALMDVFEKTRPTAVLHFAAKISVAESVQSPDLYFQNNVVGSKNLLHAMKTYECKRIVFSSTAAVYGKVEDVKIANKPLTETTVLKPINPYGKTKLMMEEAIQSAHADWGLRSVIFRYFNAAGASISGRLGECHEPETHLIPLMIRAAFSGNTLPVYGVNYDTRDGSCIRDYVHVSDLALAHLLGLKKILSEETTPSLYNLGTARGSSVLEVIDAVQVITGKTVRTDVKPNRAGDSAVLIADSTRAKLELGWEPKHSSLHSILKSVIQWESKARA
jgi:UDP-glucose 4-epimerase